MKPKLYWLFCLLLALPCQLSAAELELAGGTTFDRYRTLHESGVVNLNLVTNPRERFPTEWSIGLLLAQDKNPSYLDNDEATAWLGIAKRARWKGLFVGFGLVVVDQTNQRISSHVNFKSSAGFELGPLVAQVQHISNAGFHGTNDGDSFVTLGFRIPLGP
ncbi:acyloxyacyl hydrolase [Thioalkalivibrio sp. XN279]|uniref:acyloxyacyl hydrolase n=1 Tax=Thioalkalivibrio sp. XN279 TaxID=2714953 RepID=UPI00140B0258|nr:acyloxyacyl hydrolase [Thioalkalivibrio sp. XN279]NHA13980.1 acyloxyacyl hydrolase [Thioalkalivibrio sp. XN279]